MGEDRPSFMVIDANDVSWSQGESLGASLTRAEVMSGPTRDVAFSILDKVVFDDPRVNGFLRGSGS
jgi:hypothetical protein